MMKICRLKLGRTSARLLSTALASLAPVATVAAIETLAPHPAHAGIVKEDNPGAQASTVKTGLRYWIELNRKGKTFHVTNAQNFVAGDRIRFHVQPTVDGFAYIVLRSGSQGEQAVLFPMENSKDDNRLHREVDYPLPADDYLTFDAHPGTEKVTLLFSKHSISGSQIVSTSIAGANHVVIRSTPGSKDLIPAHTSVVYQPAESQTITVEEGDKSTSAEAITPTQAQIAENKNKNQSDNKDNDKDKQASPIVAANPAEQKQPSDPVAHSTAAPVVAAAPSTGEKIEKKVASEQKKSSTASNSSTPSESVKSTSGAVLVREDDPDRVLHIDVDLEHSGT